MIVSKIIEVSETATDGLYVVAEYRYNESDVDPFFVKDFHWKVIPGSRTDRPKLDEYGRVTINGKKTWSTIEVDGVRIPHPELKLAEKNTTQPDPGILEDAICIKVVDFIERHKLDYISFKPSDSQAPIRGAYRKARANKAIHKAANNLVGQTVRDTKKTIKKRQEIRQRPARATSRNKGNGRDVLGS